MNGKYMRKAEIRWTSRDKARLEHIRAKKAKKMPPRPQYVRQPTPIETLEKWAKDCESRSAEAFNLF